MPQPFADEIRSIPMSAALGDSLERARGFAREQSHRTVTLEHLLLAFTEDPDASAVLQASNIDLLRLGTEVSGYLSRLPDDTGSQAQSEADPLPDGELVRVLQAAVQAAQQSRRRHIDGAIVLAAVVGDGKSPAAALLKEHGLTFEEAIRALQKANAKANAQARSKQFATSSQGAVAPAPSPEAAAPPPAAAPAPSEAAARSAGEPPARSPVPNGHAAEGVGQTVEEILAAARARIQQRAASTSQAVKPASPAPATPPAEPPAPPRASAPPVGPAAAEPPRPGQEPSGPPPAAPPPTAAAPPPPPLAQPAAAATPGPRPPGAPPLGPDGSPPARPAMPQPAPGQRTAPPFQQVLRSGEGPPRPPLPGRVEPNLPPQRRSGTAPMPPPWPSPEAPAANGAALLDGHMSPPRPAPGPASGTGPGPRRPAQRAGGGQSGPGPLVESIPRRMRVGVTATAQVRISRERVDSLVMLLMKAKGVSQRPDALMARALTVRLTAPDGGFWIEAHSPETQWAEAAAGGDRQQEEQHLTWRWSVTPQDRGRGRLQLVVTARTVGRDGAVAETAPPDRIIEVAVSRGRFNGPRRWPGILFALVVGAVLGRFGGEAWTIVSALIKRFAG